MRAIFAHLTRLPHLPRAAVATAVVAFVALAPPAPAAGRAQAQTELADSAASRRKLSLEVEKLQAEVDELRATNAALTARTRLLTAWATAVGGTVAAALVALLGWLLNRTQRDKLVQDKELAREQHLLELFKGLGDAEARVRASAATVLLHRVARIRHDRRATPGDKDEARRIVSLLISSTKHEQEVDIQKYIADGIARALDAFVPSDATPSTATSPLREFDFQGAKLCNAWWKRVDARGVDFYRVDLSRAGLREAFLDGAVLKNADLTDATLVNARLVGCNLEGAKLVRADLRGANLDGANLTEADLTDAHVTPAELARAHGVDAVRLERPAVDFTAPLPVGD